MNTWENLQDNTENRSLEVCFKQLSERMISLYSKYGENLKCITNIQNEAREFYLSKLRKNDTINKIINSHLLRNSEEGGQAVYCIVDNSRLKVALHVTKKGVKFPIHSHPYALNSLLVVRGALNVSQYNIVDLKPQSKSCIIQAGFSSAGLLKTYNTHALETAAPFNVFFSIRCKVANQKVHQPRSLKLSKLLAFGVGLMALVSSYTNQHINILSQSSASTQTNTHQQLKSNMELVYRANILREKDEEAQYDAAKLYKIAADKNNPEAQYWLGYMYLLGMGITEDNYEALNWIAASARQEYPPAEKLLNQLLDSESEFDC